MKHKECREITAVGKHRARKESMGALHRVRSTSESVGEGRCSAWPNQEENDRRNCTKRKQGRSEKRTRSACTPTNQIESAYLTLIILAVRWRRRSGGWEICCQEFPRGRAKFKSPSGGFWDRWTWGTTSRASEHRRSYGLGAG